MKYLLLFIFFVPFINAQEITVGIGVMHKEKSLVSRLKTFDRARAGDEIRIFVKPKTDSYVYVVSYDDEQAFLLNPDYSTQQMDAGHLLILPSDEDFYVFDSNEEKSNITVLCSYEPLNSVTSLFNEEALASADGWKEMEDDLVDAAKTDLSEEPDKPVSMAGNVRVINNNFENKLQYFTDDTLIIKRYIISVK